MEPVGDPGWGSARFTARELEVLGHIGRGASNREVAQALFVSVTTVRNHLENVIQKLRLQIDSD